MRIIRSTLLSDLPRLRELFAAARARMAAIGNPTQWGDGYPDDDILLGDIERGVSYVITEEERIIGTFAFIIGPDPTYRIIEDGAWLDDTLPYGTIHRLAGDIHCKAIADTCFEWCATQINNLRADTYVDNAPLRHILAKHGFTYCGIIRVRNNSPRLAFQRLDDAVSLMNKNK